MAVIGTFFIAGFLFGAVFPDVDFDWPEDDEKLWPTP